MTTPNVPGGWYRDPGVDDTSSPVVRYWDGQKWTAYTRVSHSAWESGTPAGLESEPIPSDVAEVAHQEEATSSPAGQQVVSAVGGERAAAVRFPAWFWVLLALATFGILWGAAEQHDQGCYSKSIVQVASGNRDEANCLLLPWNDPATPDER